MVDLDVSHDAIATGTSGRVAFHVSAITLLTLIVNGSLVGRVYRYLHVYDESRYHNILVRRALESAEEEASKRIVELERNWFFHNTYFDLVLQAVPILSNVGSHVKYMEATVSKARGRKRGKKKSMAE